jgi:hypothetical protein
VPRTTRKRPPRLRAQWLAMLRRLAKAGVPAGKLSAFWRDGTCRWLDAYEDRECCELFACVGRGGNKSTVLYLLAVLFAVYVPWDVPIGERHWCIIISRLRSEAEKALPIISTYLRLLGVRHTVAGDAIELTEIRIGIRVVAASVAGTSGWRAVFVGMDERAKWHLSGLEEHDAEETESSAMMMTSTHARAVKVACGSAWGQFGGFFDAIRRGDTPERIVLGPAASFVANPNLTEAACRRKEPDPRRYARDVLSQFQADGLGVFDADAIDRAMGRNVGWTSHGQAELIIDPSSGRADAWAWAVVRWVADATGRWFLKFEVVDAIEGRFWEQRSSDDVVRQMAAVAHTWKCRHVYSDQRESFTLRSAFARYGLPFRSIAWTSSEAAEGSKPKAIALVRRWLLDDVLILPRDEKLRRELLSMQEKFSPSGALTYGARAGHDDRAAVVITTAMVDLSRRLKLPADAVKKPRRRLPLHLQNFEAEVGQASIRALERVSVDGGPEPGSASFIEALKQYGWLQPDDAMRAISRKGSPHVH